MCRYHCSRGEGDFDSTLRDHVVNRVAADDQWAIISIVDLGHRIDAEQVVQGCGKVFRLDRFLGGESRVFV